MPVDLFNHWIAYLQIKDGTFTTVDDKVEDIAGILGG